MIAPGAAPVDAPSHARVTVRVHEHVGEIDAAEWDSILTADDLQCSHRFVRACEDAEVENARYRHVLVYRDSHLIGIASITLMNVSLDLLSKGFTRTAIRLGRRVHPSFLRLPLAICGLPVSFGRSCLKIRAPADAPDVLLRVRRVLEEAAEELRTRTLCFKEFTTDESESMDTLLRHGWFRAASLPSCFLPLPWRSMDEYLRSMRSSYRHQVLACRRAAEHAGLQLRIVESFTSECGRIFPLYEQVIDRAEFQLERLNRRYFENLDAYLGAQSRAILLERGEQLVACAIVLYTPRHVTFLLAGIDYARNRECHAYPALVSEVIAEAIRTGAEGLELGQTSYDLKCRLGARPTERHIYFKYRTRFGHAVFRAAAGVLFPTVHLPHRRVFRRPLPA